VPPPTGRCCRRRRRRHRRRRSVVVIVVVVVVVVVATAAAAATTTTAAAATTTTAATTTIAVDRKEARIVRARAHALPRMRIERDQSLFLPPVGDVSARAVLVAAAVDATVDAISDDAEVMLTSRLPLLIIARTRRFSVEARAHASELFSFIFSRVCRSVPVFLFVFV